MKSINSIILAGFATASLAFELTFYNDTDCLKDGASDPKHGHYRIYKFSDPRLGVQDESCQTLSGTIDDQWTCVAFEDGGATGPLDCGKEQLEAYSIRQDYTDDDPLIRHVCTFYLNDDCENDVFGSEELCAGPWGSSGGNPVQSFQCSDLQVSGGGD